MVNLIKASMLKAKMGQKLGLLCQTVSKARSAEGKVLGRELKVLPSEHRMIRKENSPIADMEKVLVAWKRRSNQP